jgi:hypothetical protein
LIDERLRERLGVCSGCDGRDDECDRVWIVQG